MPFTVNDIPDEFWNIIQYAGKDQKQLRRLLINLDKDQIYRFAGYLTEAATQLNDEPFLSYLDPHDSDDSVQDISYWVVGQGKDYYARIWDNPATIPRYEDINPAEVFYGIAEEVYAQKFHEEMPALYDDSGYPIFMPGEE